LQTGPPKFISKYDRGHIKPTHTHREKERKKEKDFTPLEIGYITGIRDPYKKGKTEKERTKSRNRNSLCVMPSKS
jgi:hypothetical protein